MTKRALVCGAGGFIGNHLVKRLKKENFWVRGLDIKEPQFSNSEANEYVVCDLRDQNICQRYINKPFDEVYQLAADMGGANYIFTQEHDADIMRNNALINLNVLDSCKKANVKKIFFASSACVYPLYNQLEPDNPKCSEDSAYPAEPDSEYGWEKLFSERLYKSFGKNHGLDIRIGRLHNIYGPECAWKGGREKAPAAICRKIAENNEIVEIFGDGQQTRSFLYIDDCLEALVKLMTAEVFCGPVNIGSEEMVTINQLTQKVLEIADKSLQVKHISGPLGVRGRNSDNKLIREKLGWEPKVKMKDGLTKLYEWVKEQVQLEDNKQQITQIVNK
jgi:GDP-D-mannose 3', 5'-epimerase